MLFLALTLPERERSRGRRSGYRRVVSEDAPIRPQRYRDERPPETFLPYHERVREGEVSGFYEFFRILTVLHAVVLYRTEVIDSHLVPAGPVILAPNHASFADHFLIGSFLRRHIHFMAKSQLFAGPLTGAFYSSLGIFPVQRGIADEEAFTTAFRLLERGEVVGMYVEGGRSRTGAVGDVARPGIGRLALESGAPVVPVAVLGSHRIRNWRRGRFPRIRVQFGQPFAFERIEHPSRGQQQAVADETLRRITALHAGLAERYGNPAPRGPCAPSPSA